MGFERPRAEAALRQTSGDVEAAAEFLLLGTAAPTTSAVPPPSAAPSQALVPTSQLLEGLPPLAPAPTTATTATTATPTSINTTGATEDDMQKAIRASLADERARENNEIERAKLLSGAQPMDVVVAGVDSSEQQVQQALLASLADQQRTPDGAVLLSLPAPTHRKPGVPTGLRNTGNTCYFNSFIQTYFHIPALRRAVFETDFTAVAERLPKPAETPVATLLTAAVASGSTATGPSGTPAQTPSPATTTTATATATTNPITTSTTATHSLAVIAFMKELQRLFAGLQNAAMSYVDPSPLITALQRASGNNLRTGTQEDVGEVNILFLNTLEEGLKLAAPAPSQPPAAVGSPSMEPGTAAAAAAAATATTVEATTSLSLVEQLFQGETVEFISGEEAEGGQFEVSTKSQFRQLIVPVAREFPTLYDSMDSLMCGDVDYTSPKGHKTTAHKCSWLTKLPPVLMFQENRVRINPTSLRTEKVSLPLSFKKHIFVDRFCVEHRTTTTEIRKTVTALNRQIADFEHARLQYTRFKGRDQSIVDSLRNVLEYCTDKTDQISLTVIRELTRLHDETSSAVDAIEADISETQAQVEFAYEQQDLKQREYVLYAAWIHGGSPESGHYRAFITDPGSKKWFEFNDTFVTEVQEDVVLAQGVGSASNNISAYFLIYVQRSELERYSADLCSIRPSEALTHEIDDANRTFTTQSAAIAQFASRVGGNAIGQQHHTSLLSGEGLGASHLSAVVDSCDALRQLDNPSLFHSAPGIDPSDVGRQAQDLYRRCLREIEAKATQQFHPRDYRVEFKWVWLESSGTREHRMLTRTMMFTSAFTAAAHGAKPTESELKTALQADFVSEHEAKWAQMVPQRDLFLAIAEDIGQALSFVAQQPDLTLAAGMLVSSFRKNMELLPLLSFTEPIRLACRLCLVAAMSKALDTAPEGPSKAWEQAEEVTERVMQVLWPSDRLVQEVISRINVLWQGGLHVLAEPKLRVLVATLQQPHLPTVPLIIEAAVRTTPQEIGAALEKSWTKAIDAQQHAIIRFGSELPELKRFIDYQRLARPIGAVNSA